MDLTKEARQKARAIATEGYAKPGFFNGTQFNTDFNVFFMTKKMVSRFLKTGSLNEKLLINNIVITLNTFGVKRTNLVFRIICSDVQFSIIKAILMFLGSYHIDIGEEIHPNRIMVDILRNISQRYNLDHL